MFKNKFKIFALDGPWGPSSGNNNPGSGGRFSGGNKESIDDLLNDLKNKYKIKMPFNFTCLIAVRKSRAGHILCFL